MAVLRVRKGVEPGAVFPVFQSNDPIIIGREGQVDVPLGDAKASRRHSSICLAEGEWLIQDLESSNGTIVQGKRVEAGELKDGASIQIGGTLLTFHARDLPAPPGGEIHGARPTETLREEAGVFVFRAHQAAMDREVRCDWLHSSRHAPPGALAVFEQAVEEARKLSDPSIVAVIHAQADAEGTFVLLRGPVRPTLEEKLDEVLKLPLTLRIELFRALVDAALERATWDTLRFPIAPRHVDVDLAGTSAGGIPDVFLPALDLGALLASTSGSLPHIPHYAAYLPPEHQGTAGTPAERRDRTRLDPPALSSAMYNLGALGYHVLTGQKPMGEGPTRTILESHRTLRPAPASLLDSEIPEGLSALLEKMLEKEPQKRPSGRQEVLGAFPAPPARPAPQPAQPPSNRPVAAAQPSSAAQPFGVAPSKGAARAVAPKAQPSRSASAVSEAQRVPAPAAPREAPKRVAAEAVKESSRVPSFLYMPLWGLAWVALFFVARYLSKMVFQSMNG